MENEGENVKKDTKNERDVIQKLYSDIPEPYRTFAMKKAYEIVSDDKKTDENKKIEIQKIFEVSKAISACVSDITRSIKELRSEIDNSQNYLQIFEELGKREHVEEFKLDIQETRQFIAKTNVTIDEIVKNMDLQGAKELLKQVDSKRKKSELILSRVQSSGKVKRVLKREEEPENKKRFNLNEKTKKIMRRLGAISLATLMGVYITTGVINKVSSVDLEDDYENGTTVESIIESGDLKEIFRIIDQGKYKTYEEFQETYEEFQESFVGLAEAVETYVKYDEKKKLTSQERSEFYESALEILNYPDFNQSMIKLIKAKLANAVEKNNKGFNKCQYESNIEIGRYVTHEDGYNDNYKYIKYKVKEKEERTITNTDQFTIGLFSKDKNGRMKAEFVDIVDIYLELISNQEMSEEKRAEIFQAVAAFLDKEIEVEQRKPYKGKLQISDREDDDGR